MNHRKFRKRSPVCLDKLWRNGKSPSKSLERLATHEVADYYGWQFVTLNIQFVLEVAGPSKFAAGERWQFV